MTPTGLREERSKCKRLMGTATFSIITKPVFRNGSTSGRTSQCHLSNQIIVPQFGGNWRALAPERNDRSRRNVVFRKRPHCGLLSTQKQTFIAHLGAALQNATSPASYSTWRGSRSCASCDQDRDDEEDEKASERARLVATEVEQQEPDQQRDRHSRSPSGAGLLQCRSPGACAMRRDWAPISG